MRFVTTAAAAGFCLAGFCLAGFGTASAHISLETKSAKVGATVHAIFDVGHGCSGSPTTKLRLKIPTGVVAVVPDPKPGWTIETVTEKYDKSYSAHGAAATEGVGEVDWSGLLPPHQIGKFALTFVISDILDPDQRLYFPIVQECKSGIVRWIDKSGDEHPAPSLQLLSAH